VATGIRIRSCGVARGRSVEEIPGLQATPLTAMHVVVVAVVAVVAVVIVVIVVIVVVEGAETRTAVAAELAVHFLRHATRSGHRHGSWPGVLGKTLGCV